MRLGTKLSVLTGVIDGVEDHAASCILRLKNKTASDMSSVDFKRTGILNALSAISRNRGQLVFLLCSTHFAARSWIAVCSFTKIGEWSEDRSRQL